MFSKTTQDSVDKFESFAAPCVLLAVDPMRRLSSSPCCDQPTMRATAGRRSSSPTARATSGATTGERMGAKLRARMVGPRLSAGPSGQRARRMHARRRLGAARS